MTTSTPQARPEWSMSLFFYLCIIFIPMLLAGLFTPWSFLLAAAVEGAFAFFCWRLWRAGSRYGELRWFVGAALVTGLCIAGFVWTATHPM